MGATPRAEVRAHAERALARAAPLAKRLSEAARALPRLPRHAGVCALRGERPEPAARAGDTGRARIPPGKGIGCLSARSEATAADELAKDPRYLPRSETRPKIAVPGRRGDRPAAIDADRHAPAAFGASDCAFLEEPAALVEPASP